jgi:hypothetical protein
MAEELARQLDGILDLYNRRVEEQKSARSRPEKQEVEDAFLADFERIKVEAIKPAMEEVGKYLESKEQEYQIKDEISLFHGNPKITMEIFPIHMQMDMILMKIQAFHLLQKGPRSGLAFKKITGCPANPEV